MTAGASVVAYENSEAFARAMDAHDEIARYREEFIFPTLESIKSGKWEVGQGEPCIYFAGNSLGLQPRRVREYIGGELDNWAAYGVEGHFSGRLPWLPYHENLTEMTARLVGAKPLEVVVMNTLTTNLHLMMVSFYRPTKERYKILIESDAFPSDRYAVGSQARFHGFDPKEAVIELKPRQGEETLRTEDILNTIEREGDKLALVLLGNVNYLTGQAFRVEAIARTAHENGAHIGLNLAHGAGNLLLELHDWDVDFAVWCSYKYLNSGPGSLAGCFVHERHANSFDLPRFAGWWGHDKETRFQMGPQFNPISGAEGWQLSNPPIFQLAALRASLELFDQAGMVALRAKGDRLTGYLEFLMDEIPREFCRIITPRDPEQRGSQLSMVFGGNPKELLKVFREHGVICDFREPNIIRATPAPLYCSFMDVYRFANIIRKFAQ